MATIGTFKKSGNEYTGEIVTLSVRVSGVRIIPDTRATDTCPHPGLATAATPAPSGPALQPAAMRTSRRSGHYPRPGPTHDEGGEGYSPIWFSCRPP